jgi:hypothetical protein
MMQHPSDIIQLFYFVASAEPNIAAGSRTVALKMVLILIPHAYANLEEPRLIHKPVNLPPYNRELPVFLNISVQEITTNTIIWFVVEISRPEVQVC